MLVKSMRRPAICIALASPLIQEFQGFPNNCLTDMINRLNPEIVATSRASSILRGKAMRFSVNRSAPTELNPGIDVRAALYP